MKKINKYLIYFLVSFFIMQIIDLILTSYALNIGGKELNPLYEIKYFTFIKLFIPFLITGIYYIFFEKYKKYIFIGMRINILMYIFILLNNVTQIIKGVN